MEKLRKKKFLRKLLRFATNTLLAIKRILEKPPPDRSNQFVNLFENE